MALKDSINSAVVAAVGTSWPQVRIDQTVAYFSDIGAFTLASDSSLSIKANLIGAVLAACPQLALPGTAVSSASSSATTLAALKDLANAGIIQGITFMDGLTTVRSV